MTLRLALVAAVGALVAAPAWPAPLAAPRSAIPWLSESILNTAAPPLPRDAGPSPAPDTDTIAVTPLGDVSRDAVGLLPPETTGFRRDLWGSDPATKVRSLILAQPARGVPAAIMLFRSVLLAEADPPPGSGSNSGVLVARVDRLLEMGALEEVEALLADAGPNNPDLFRQWFDAGLLLDRAQPPCEALRRNPSLSPTLPARVFCLARGGDWNAAEITLTLGQNVGSISADEERLLARFLDPESFEDQPEPPVPDPLTPLDFLLREAVGLSRPGGELPLAFLQGDLDEHTPMRTRITSAERLVLSGAKDQGVLFDAYRAGEPPASGGIWTRAMAVQALDAALAGGSPEAIGAALNAADAALNARGLRVALAREYAPALAGLDGNSLPAAARVPLVELLLLAGETEAARTMAGVVPGPRVATLLAVAGTGEEAPGPADPLMKAALDGLAERPPADDRELQLAGLVSAGQQGEAILSALALVQAGSAVDPPALQAALFGLRTAGQIGPARAIALQTLLTQTAG